MSWCIYELTQHQDVAEKLYKEIVEHVDMREEDNGLRVPTYAQCSELKYMEAVSHHLMPFQSTQNEFLCACACACACAQILQVLKETLRLHPSAPINQKHFEEDDVLPNGALVRKGSTVVFSMYTMGRRKGIWGEYDANEFVPERWFGPNNFSPWQFFAFSGGPRLCLGQNFAMMEMKVVLSALLSKYRFKLSAQLNAADVTYESSATHPYVYCQPTQPLQHYHRTNF